MSETSNTPTPTQPTPKELVLSYRKRAADALTQIQETKQKLQQQLNSLNNAEISVIAQRDLVENMILQLGYDNKEVAAETQN